MEVTATDQTMAVFEGRKPKDRARDMQGEFMRLLAAEMRYQDPLSPLENKDIVSQVAQVSTLESMEGIRKLFAASLVGRTVSAVKNGVKVEGVVWGVKLRDGVGVLVGETEVSLEDIVGVR